MEIDLTAVADEVAETIWDSRIMIHGRPPFAQLTLAQKNALKEQILPAIYYTVPIVEKAIKDKIDREVEWEVEYTSAAAALEIVREEIKNL
jgi:hypothetical protein